MNMLNITQSKLSYGECGISLYILQRLKIVGHVEVKLVKLTTSINHDPVACDGNDWLWGLVLENLVP